jgi:hypothetical protein
MKSLNLKNLETCKNCQNQFTGKFCNACGQKVYTDDDKSIKHIFEELFHFFTHFEGKFFTTLKSIFTKPGQLSLDYSSGKRQKYFKPISLYLFIVIIYLLLPFSKGFHPPLQQVRYNDPLGYNINEKIEAIKKEKQYSEEAITYRYNSITDKLSKVLLFLLIPLTALILFLLSFKKMYIFDYFILATEISIFFLLLINFIFPITLMVPEYFSAKPIDENYLLSALYIVFGVYLIITFRRYFKEKLVLSIAKIIIFPFLHFFIVLMVYRLLLVLLTLQLV